MAYLVLARKYRPQTFDDVIGQGHVTRTLQNAIGSGRVAHAMLFSGPRGSGKTTIARILAKAMNCAAGATPTPCNTCRSCTDITAGRGADVFEIDGASNNSVDQVRELRDNIRYMPAHSPYKIYIIDEVHMLSIAAFNALLKTLEEPPAHVLFFFATTEAHKIPVTILSRCQRHDLRRIDPPAVVAHLETICRQESVAVAAGNLWAIARETDGSMRDALSLLDQVLACRDSQMNDDDVARLLGVMDRQLISDLSASIIAGDINRALATVATAYRHGYDLKRFYGDLLVHFRQLMLIKLQAPPDMLDTLTAGERDLLAQQVAQVSTATIDQLFRLLFEAETSVRQASHPRLAIEMVLFKRQQITPALPIDVLIERLDALLANAPAASGAGVVESQTDYGMTSVPASNPSSDRADRGGASVPGCSPAPASSGDCRNAPTADAADGEHAWQQVIAAVAQGKPSVAAALSRATLAAATPTAFDVRVCDNDYTVNLLKKHLAWVETICRDHAGRGIHFDFTDGAAGPADAGSAKQKADALRQQLLNHPLVADAVDIFNGKIEAIKIK